MCMYTLICCFYLSGAGHEPDPSDRFVYDDDFRSHFLQAYIEATLLSIRSKKFYTTVADADSLYVTLCLPSLCLCSVWLQERLKRARLLRMVFHGRLRGLVRLQVPVRPVRGRLRRQKQDTVRTALRAVVRWLSPRRRAQACGSAGRLWGLLRVIIGQT